VVGAYPGSMVVDREWRARHAAFEWLIELGAPRSEITRAMLTRGFELDGIRIPLLGPQGIWSPAGFRVPLSIATIPSGPYADRVDINSNQLRYSYRGTDPEHRDNVGLRRAMGQGTPLIYFFRTDPGHYLANWPVYVVGDDRAALTFSVKFDETWVLEGTPADARELVDVPLRREYATRIVRQRLFQAEFRRRVVDAYRQRCALCSLRHRELLDAAHITADSDSGEPIVSNGMSLCKLHHAAFDNYFFAITPDYRVVVRPSILAESDGPMLIVGLQQIEGSRINLPDRADQLPDRDRLAARYEAFTRAS
jgi:putative restriction endonuclease